ncbi:MAG: hypothetical protein JWQ74_1233 [Marmoricola sp.]|nr:hypothetical protein [Marmoricola sp.]
MLHQGTRWVMRVSRLRACADERGADRFVAAFEDRRLTASPSRLSRWEYGRSNGSARLLRAYEDGTGLPPYLLFALNDRQQRTTDDEFAAKPSVDISEEITAEDVYAILDRAVSTQEVTGSEWYAMAAYAATTGYFYLAPSNTRYVAQRMLNELARSVGDGYLLRFEALHLMAGMPRVGPAMVEGLLRLITDDRTGMLGDAVSLILRPTPEVGRAMAHHLRATGTEAGQQASTWFEDLVPARPQPTEPVLSRAEVLALRNAVCEDLPSWAAAHLEDEVTNPLVETALGAATRAERHEASALMMAGHLSEPLGPAVLDALEAEEDPARRTRLAHLHEYLVPSLDPERVEALALAEQDPEVRRALWNSRAHAQLPIQRSVAVMNQLADPDVRAPIASAMGMTGSVDRELLDHDELGELHGVLSWWSTHGPALHT